MVGKKRVMLKYLPNGFRDAASVEVFKSTNKSKKIVLHLQLVVFHNLSMEKDLPHCREVKRVCIARYFFLTEVPLAVS